MRKLALALLLVTVTASGFSQMLHKQFHVSKPSKNMESFLERNNNSPGNPNLNVVYGQINGNDTLLIVYLPEVDINLLSRYYEITSTRQGRRLANNVRKVYPYAKIAGDKMKEYDTLLANIDSHSERKRLMKQAEDEITNQYTEELKKLNFSQGAILIRLIDRETGSTSYKVVQELRGRMRAFFYQGFARLWGYNLKTEYDPAHNQEDEEIETIITLLERGQI